MIRTGVLAFLILTTFIARPRSAKAQVNDINPTLPETARSTEEIEHALDSHKGFGNPQSVRLNSHGRYLFVIWNCPYSGLDLNHIWAFYFDGNYWRKFYTAGIHAAPPAVSPKLNEGEDQIVINGRRPSDRITVSLRAIQSTATTPP